MTKDEFIAVFDLDSDINWEGCNALQGLNIIAKYLPKQGIEGADHDVIYSAKIDEIVEAGITPEDANKLRDLNWMLEDDYCLACFV